MQFYTLSTSLQPCLRYSYRKNTIILIYNTPLTTRKLQQQQTTISALFTSQLHNRKKSQSPIQNHQSSTVYSMKIAERIQRLLDTVGPQEARYYYIIIIKPV